MIRIFKVLFNFCFYSFGGGGSQQQAKPAAKVSYRKEGTREMKSGSNRKALASRYMQTRKATPSGGGGFGGTKQTLG